MFLLTWLQTLSPAAAALFCVAENVLLFGGAMLLGHGLLWLYGDRRVTETPEPLQWQEVAWAASCVALNAVVTFAGWVLWTRGIIRIDAGPLWRVGVDLAVLFFAMDLAMYVFHRLAHLPWVFPWVHATHHRYDKPRPLNLFVLNPFEVLGFGGLWLAVLIVYPPTFYGMAIYLGLNLLFGTVGHLGVEPLPRNALTRPLLRFLGTSTFHARHHQHATINFGFYTTLWDRLFKTLYWKYHQTFGRLDASSGPS